MQEDTAVRAGESFSAEERRALTPFFTNVDRPVFALRNLPEVVKAALFARYSRSAKSLRRLFLDEFLEGAADGTIAQAVGVSRSEKLFDRVLSDYGDDSVAQLGGAHVAVEGASNILTKALEWGRLMAYLEQSTRYVPYTTRDAAGWRYVVPSELQGSPLVADYRSCSDRAFETYARWLPVATEWFRGRVPRPPSASEASYAATVRAKALDALRGLLPAAARSNVGLFGSGQAYEQLLLRLRAHPLAEARDCAGAILAELDQVIPAFLKRVDRPDRGHKTTEYLADTRRSTESVAAELLADVGPERRAEVTLTDFDPDGETKVVAAALYAVSDLPDDQLQRAVSGMSVADRARVLGACVGDRSGNRRHRPGRAFERTWYRFDVLTDYGCFRDLQRHRMLTVEWQRFSPRHGYDLPAAVQEMGAAADWTGVMEAAAALHSRVAGQALPDVAAYVLPMAFRVRFQMTMNAREAMHLLELRTSPQGHPAYRRVCQQMHRLIAEQAGHRAIADSMRHVDHSSGEQGRLDAERASESKLAGRLGPTI